MSVKGSGLPCIKGWTISDTHGAVSFWICSIAAPREASVARETATISERGSRNRLNYCSPIIQDLRDSNRACCRESQVPIAARHL